MKPNQVNKLYAKLTPHEQAALVLEAAARLDINEANAILAQVEQKQYLSTNADYTKRIGALTVLVGQYGIEYWKNRTLMLIACDLADNGNKQAELTANQFFDKTVALELALIDVCKRFKVDVAAIKTMVSCPPDEAKGFLFPDVDTELVKQYAEMFSGIISS